ncbi:MAG TPA: hypothetical protein VFQ96_07995 [Microbacteriaceae bacterium]|nr:hypothetical protein [Microbacteriaceae bacterium]
MSARLTAPLAVMVGIGGAAIVAGGMVSAATGPLGWAKGSWASAYLVLVAGAAQVAYGLLQRPLARRVPSARIVVWQIVLFNLGNALVLAGSLATIPVVVDVGGAAIVAALVLFLAAVRRRAAAHPAAVWTYRGLTVLLLVSIPVGLTISTLQA